MEISKMNELVEQYAKLRAAKEEAQATLDACTAACEGAKRELIALLEQNELINYRAPAGLVSITLKKMATTPKTPEDKRAWLNYLLSKHGTVETLMDMGLLSTNSQKLQSFIKEETELALERGEEDVSFPGIPEIKEEPNLSFRRG